jgi:hypothetical protein
MRSLRAAAVSEVRRVGGEIYGPLVLRHHYARRIPTVQYAYGLFEMAHLHPQCVGVVTFGPPSSPQVSNSCAIESHREYVLELNRLVISSDDPNAGSRLVSGALRQIGKWIVVSYADSAMGHVGYVYQAANFEYAGTQASHDSEYVVGGVKTHPRTLAARGISDPVRWAAENGIARVAAAPKHRYITVTGNRRERKWLRNGISWPMSREYPKGDTSRYDAGRPDIQASLF